jgi:hypothetical protein
MANAPFSGQDGKGYEVIWVNSKEEYFLRKG